MISFIVPARNEEENIENCIKSIKGLEIKNYEIIVVDDNSNDRTYEIIRRIEGVKAIRIYEKPIEAVGKNYALYVGYLNSKGDILIFLDADVIVSNEGIEEALKLLKNYDVVSFSPKQITKTIWEFSIQPIMFKFLEYIYPYSNSVALNGQFIAIKRDVYETIGTHKVILSEILEDVKFAKLLNQNGYKIYFNETKKVSCRMYKNLKEIIYGWSKNLYLLADGLKIFKFTFKYLLLIAFWYILIFSSILKNNFLLLFIFLLLSNLEFYYNFKNYKPYNLFSATFGIILFIMIAINSFYWHEVKKIVYWKGREIKVS